MPDLDLRGSSRRQPQRLTPAAVLLATLCVAWPPTGHALAQEPAFPPCRIRGVIVDTAGQPRAGARVALEFGASNSGRWLPPFSPPEPVTTGADGAFLFSIEKPGRYIYLAVQDERLEFARWFLNGVGLGEQVDFGHLTLTEATLLRVSLVDEDGGLLTDGWRVMVSRDDRRELYQRFPIDVAVDPHTGMASFPRAFVGPCKLVARGPRGCWVHKEIVLHPEVEQSVELVIAGPKLYELLVVTPTLADNGWLPRENGTLVAVGPDGERRPLVDSPDFLFRQVVQLPLEGEWLLAVADPRYVLESDVAVRAGQNITVRLRGSSALTLDVRELGSDRSIDTYRLEEHRTEVPRIVRLAGAPCPEGGRYDGFVAGDFDLALFVEGRPARSLRVEALAPGETRTLRVLFGAGQALLGRVVDTEGLPLTRGKVRVAAYVAEGLRPRSRKGSSQSDGRERLEASLRSDGSFELAGLACGTFDVTVELPDGRHAAAIVDVPQSGPLELRAAEREPSSPPPPASR